MAGTKRSDTTITTLGRVRSGGYASLFSEGVERSGPQAPSAPSGGLARAFANLVAESVHTLFPQPARRPASARAPAPVQARARSAT